MKKKALGKGLKAFLPENYGILREERYAELDIEMLKPNPLQPRKKIDPNSLDELARSIRTSGILQPIVVVPQEDGYMIIVGERRWRAAQKAGLNKIPALIRDVPKDQQIEASLVENLQREDLNPIEIALTYKKLTAETGLTQQEVAEKVGKDRTSVTNIIRLLKLPDEIQTILAERKLSMGHARALLGLDNPDTQVSLAREIVQKNLSVRDAEKLVSRLKRPPSKEKRSEPDPNLAALQEELVERLGTKVSIIGTNNKGVMKLYYYSSDDLNRIYDRIKGENR
jgi:ParB family chromosome partitioning protein